MTSNMTDRIKDGKRVISFPPCNQKDRTILKSRDCVLTFGEDYLMQRLHYKSLDEFTDSGDELLVKQVETLVDQEEVIKKSAIANIFWYWSEDQETYRICIDHGNLAYIITGDKAFTIQLFSILVDWWMNIKY